MKKITLFVLTLLLSLVFFQPVKGQTQFTSTYSPKAVNLQSDANAIIQKVFQFKGQVDTAKSAGAEITSITSDAFQIAGFTDSTYHPFVEAFLTGNTAHLRKVSAQFLLATLKEGPYLTTLQILTADSVDGATTPITKTMTFPKRYSWAKLKIYKATGNIKTAFDIRAVLPKKELIH